MKHCQHMVPIGKNVHAEHACWEPLDENNRCPIHGAQCVIPIEADELAFHQARALARQTIVVFHLTNVIK